MSRIRTYLMVGVLALTGAACADDGSSLTGSTRRGADDSAAQDQGRGGGSTRTLVEIALTGSVAFPSAKGKAKFRVKDGQRELEIEVEHLFQMAGQTVNFFVGGTMVGGGVVSSLGQADLALNTRLGHTVPTSVGGQPVEARATNGTLIASGSF